MFSKKVVEQDKVVVPRQIIAKPENVMRVEQNLSELSFVDTLKVLSSGEIDNTISKARQVFE